MLLVQLDRTPSYFFVPHPPLAPAWAASLSISALVLFVVVIVVVAAISRSRFRGEETLGAAALGAAATCAFEMGGVQPLNLAARLSASNKPSMLTRCSNS
mmetsp:Transcript_27706/g.52501  ORF Transcript_27706/g.52501 Transcript_27706/m.52501 type:complete len:100 (-) Transcript_27706:1017-1316(-)